MAARSFPFPAVSRGPRGVEVRLFFQCLLVYAAVLGYCAGFWYCVYWAIRAAI